MHQRHVLFAGRLRRHLRHPAVQREVLLQRRRDRAQAPLMFRVAPAGVVQHRRRVHEEGGGPHARPAGSLVRAIRSWMLRISGRRVRMAVTASTAALVADIVVRYGTLYAIAARRMA